jgi:uncharacterized protein (TIGR03437 family)
VAVFQCSGASCTAAPIDLGATGDAVFVTLFGTGLRKNSGIANVTAAVGGVDAPVAFAGPQGEFAGLDQVNAQIPPAVRGRGDVPVVITVDGQATNSVVVSIR